MSFQLAPIRSLVWPLLHIVKGRCLHTASIRLSLKKIPGMTSQLGNYSEEPQKKLRDRIRDGLPPLSESRHIRLIYDCGLQNYIYFGQAFAFLMTPTTLGIGIYHFLNTQEIPDAFWDGNSNPFMMGILVLLAFGQMSVVFGCINSCVLRIYYDDEKEKFLMAFPNMFVPMKTRILVVPELSLSKKKTRWMPGLFYKIDQVGRTVLLFTDRFAIPLYFNKLVK